MENVKQKEWSPNYPVPESDHKAYRARLKKEMAKLKVEIKEIEKHPLNEEDVWATVGKIRYGHPATALHLRYNALKWFYKYPPDPRGEPMYSRAAPYTVYVRREDMAEVLPCSVSTVDRMLALLRKQGYIQPYEKITVERFCFLHKLPEDKIQQQLHELFLKRWNKNKPK